MGEACRVVNKEKVHVNSFSLQGEYWAGKE